VCAILGRAQLWVGVTGGAGCIGSVTAHYLCARGHEVVVLDSLVHGFAEALPAQAALVQANVGDRRGLDRALPGCAAVVHCAGFIEPAESVVAPELYFRNNVAAPLALLEACLRHGCLRIVFSSSCAVYGDPQELPVSEAAPTRPMSPYGLSKLMFEEMLGAFRVAHDLRSISLQYFNAAGAWPDGTLGEAHAPETRLVPRVLRSIAQSAPRTVHGTDHATPDGTCVRDYVSVVDLARAHAAAIDLLLAGGECATVNLGAGRGYSVREVIAACEQVTGVAVVVEEGPRRQGDPPLLVAGADRAESVLGWRPERSDLPTMVGDAWRWHRGHQEGYRS
jgi:UDP-glucose-4-epimerase GalE